MNITEITDADVPHVTLLWQACGLVRPWNDPESDIALARAKPASTILVGRLGDTVVASAMAGFDGHRGWLYYVAVRPDLQGNGYGRQIIAAAEDWLRAEECPKVELIIRADNHAVKELYTAVGYVEEPRALMSKWLKEPPVPSTDMAKPRELEITITFLEMTAGPKRSLAIAPSSKRPLSVQRAHNPSVHFYRYLQHTIGDPWLWADRRLQSDEEIAEIISDPAVEIYFLTVGGVPAGLVELDFRDMATTGAELAYFGLMPEFIGQGLGPFLLDWAVDCVWNREPAPEVLKVNTCTLDHPKALGGYQKAGFEVTRQLTKMSYDPIAEGYISRSVKILTPGYEPPP